MRPVRHRKKEDALPTTLANGGRMWSLSSFISNPNKAAWRTLPHEILRSYAYDLSNSRSWIRTGCGFSELDEIVRIGMECTAYAREAHISTPVHPDVSLKKRGSPSEPYEPSALPGRAWKCDWDEKPGVVTGNTAKDVRIDVALDYPLRYRATEDIIGVALNSTAANCRLTARVPDLSVWLGRIRPHAISFPIRKHRTFDERSWDRQPKITIPQTTASVQLNPTSTSSVYIGSQPIISRIPKQRVFLNPKDRNPMPCCRWTYLS
jgi:hypothetical protein